MNTHHARARRLAGPQACEAIEKNPGITEHEVMAVIADAWPNLDAHQVELRAIQLLAFEKTVRDRLARGEPLNGRRAPGRHRPGPHRPAVRTHRTVGAG